jgi:D-lactate dehydrogenase
MMLSQGRCSSQRLLLAACRRQRSSITSSILNRPQQRVASTQAGAAKADDVAIVSGSSSYRSQVAVALVSLSIGFGMGQLWKPVIVDTEVEDSTDSTKQGPVLPNGLPRTCCDRKEERLTYEQRGLQQTLSRIVGAENVIDGRVKSLASRNYLTGARVASGGSGKALCIVTPRRLHQVIDCVEAIVDADCAVLPQGQNTGLTGGSVPHTHEDSNRPTVVLSMKYLDRLFPIDNGDRVVCLAGVGLSSLQKFLDEFFPDRESHSVLGSTFLNPTTAAGVAFGSGGTQCRKGPAYTERALYLKVSTNKWKENVIEVVDTLGVKSFEEKEIQEGRARKMDSVAYRIDTWSRYIHEGLARDMRYTIKGVKAPASDTDYVERLCRHDSEVSRCNADTRGPELNRSEGKVVILATVHDTFPKPKNTKTFWLGFDSLETALEFRREVCLDNPKDIPISAEYMDRDAFDVIDRSGRVLASTIKLVGTSSLVVRQLWNIKLWIEGLPIAGAPLFVDKFLHAVNPIVPPVLPRKVREIGRQMDHHVALTVGEFGDGNMERLLDRLHAFAAKHGKDKLAIHECGSPSEVSSLNAFRFAAAPAFRTWCVGEGVQGFSVDYALPKKGGQEPPLDETAAKPIKRMRYSHFGCNVVHEDLAYGLDVDIDKAKHELKDVVEHKCGGKLPAEHGHGTEYKAPPETQARWKKMDPLNALNPGIGGLSEKYKYKE